MFDVIIYEKDGKRHQYDHVSQITNIYDYVVIDFITDFGDHFTKAFFNNNVDSIIVRVVK